MPTSLPESFCAHFYQHENQRLKARFHIWQLPDSDCLTVERVLPDLSKKCVAKEFSALNEWAFRTDPEFSERRSFMKRLWDTREEGQSIVVF